MLTVIWISLEGKQLMIGSTSISREKQSRRRGCHLCLIASATSSKINLAFFPASGRSIQTHMAGPTQSAISGYMTTSHWLPRPFLSRLLPSPLMRFSAASCTNLSSKCTFTHKQMRTESCST